VPESAIGAARSVPFGCRVAKGILCTIARPDGRAGSQHGKRVAVPYLAAGRTNTSKGMIDISRVPLRTVIGKG